MSVAQAIALYEGMPTMEGIRKARLVEVDAAGNRPLRPLGYRKGHGHTPRTKA